MNKVVILVPWRTDNGHRERLWRLAKARWKHLFPDWPIYEGPSPEGPWNRAAAVNAAARQAGDWDIALICDADVVLTRQQVVDAVNMAAGTEKVTWAHTGWRELSESVTETLLRDPGLLMEPDLPLAESHVGTKVNHRGKVVPCETSISWSCCMAVPRKVWNALGGMDERFQGWGGEDTAFAAAVQGLHGHERMSGWVWNLWHPRSPGDGQESTSRDYVNNMRLRNRYAVALRRDHNLHDRDEPPASEGKRVQDLHNYDVSEKRYASLAASMGLPDWSKWWPTLHELVTGVHVPNVALIVHSGGDMAMWPTRKEYLRRTLASLNERLVLPSWERKVVLSDWGEEARLELDAIADEAGFYVKDLGRTRDGSGVRLGYTGSMQAEWRYVSRFVRADYVFRTEDDFVLDRDVDIARMAEVMASRPKVVQMALLRDENPRKLERGGLLGHPLDAFTRHGTHMEHQLFFTCNPSLMRTETFDRFPWPSEDSMTRKLGSERVYHEMYLRPAGMRSALWGDGEQWVSHIGWDARSQLVAAY